MLERQEIQALQIDILSIETMEVLKTAFLFEFHLCVFVTAVSRMLRMCFLPISHQKYMATPKKLDLSALVLTWHFPGSSLTDSIKINRPDHNIRMY